MARQEANGRTNGSGGVAAGRSTPNTAFERTSFFMAATPPMSSNSRIAICAIRPR